MSLLCIDIIKTAKNGWDAAAEKVVQFLRDLHLKTIEYSPNGLDLNNFRVKVWVKHLDGIWAEIGKCLSGVQKSGNV